MAAFKELVAKTSNPSMVEHVEKQPREVAQQEQNVRERSPLKVKSENFNIADHDFFCNTSYHRYCIINPLCAFHIL